MSTILFKSFENGGNWNESETKTGKRKFSCVWAGVWLNVVINDDNTLFITYGKQIYDNNILWIEEEKENIFSQVLELITTSEPVKKPNLAIKYAEEKAEYGKREVEKQNKEVKAKKKPYVKYEKKPYVKYEKKPEKEPDYFGDGFD
jgi:hypothetical protein